MLSGIVSAQSLVASGGGSSLPAMINFVAGTASIGGASVSIASTVAHPELISGSGLAVGSTTVKLVGDMLAAFVGNTEFTVVIEFERTGGASYCNVFEMLDAGNGLWVIDSYSYTTSVIDGGPSSYVVASNYEDRVSTMKVAATRRAGNAAICANGGAVGTGTDTANTLSYESVFLGGDPDYADRLTGNILSVAIYAPQDDADLPALSTL